MEIVFIRGAKEKYPSGGEKVSAGKLQRYNFFNKSQMIQLDFGNGDKIYALPA